MVVGNYRDLFAVIAESSATLTGLLFVAISVAPRPAAASHSGVVQQVRAAASLMALTSALAVSLFGLVPGDDVGYPAAVLGVIGILFTAAAMRSIFASTATNQLRRRQLGLIILLTATFGLDLATGIVLIVNRHSVGALDLLCNVLLVSLLIGVARAWELVGNRDTGIAASIAVLSGHSAGAGRTLPLDDPGPAGPADPGGDR